ncbi:MAG: type II toxin-antitoxin system VapC family toxin [bacterium]
MKYLLDTHAFLWWMTAPERLPRTVVGLMQSDPGVIAFSSISAWEMAIKTSLGKLKGVPLQDLPGEVKAQGWQRLPFTTDHAVRVADLPAYHGDPFDRALIAQAMVEDLVLLSADVALKQYDIRTIW